MNDAETPRLRGTPSDREPAHLPLPPVQPVAARDPVRDLLVGVIVLAFTIGIILAAVQRF